VAPLPIPVSLLVNAFVRHRFSTFLTFRGRDGPYTGVEAHPVNTVSLLVGDERRCHSAHSLLTLGYTGGWSSSSHIPVSLVDGERVVNTPTRFSTETLECQKQLKDTSLANDS